MNDFEKSKRDIIIVNQALGDIAEQFVFIGGATVGLYSTNEEQIDARPTTDIDILVESYSLADYEEIEQKLRKKGFANDTESSVICRWILRGIQPITVDIMYPNIKKFGFINSWYKEALQNLITYELNEANIIKIFNAVYFVACKLEAYADRGMEDCRFDNDFADIAYIIANRKEFIDELAKSPDSVKQFIVLEINKLIQKDIKECLIALGPDIGGSKGAEQTYKRLQEITQL